MHHGPYMGPGGPSPNKRAGNGPARTEPTGPARGWVPAGTHDVWPMGHDRWPMGLPYVLCPMSCPMSCGVTYVCPAARHHRNSPRFVRVCCGDGRILQEFYEFVATVQKTYKEMHENMLALSRHKVYHTVFTRPLCLTG